jgi:hypothetical protein
MRLILIVVVLVTAIAAAVMFLRSRRPLVLGMQLAEADARDRRHQEQFAHLSSPLPQRRYDPAQGEITLIDPQVSELDRQLRAICSRAAASSAEERREFRNGATGDDFYTLLTFARRAAVFALRDRDGQWIEEALAAVAMIDSERIDVRDLPMALSLVHHASERLQLPSLQLFDTAAVLAEPGTGEIIRSFVRRPAADKDIQSSWGYQEIEGPGGAGFVQSEFEAYEPTQNLLGAALAIREAILRDRYEGDVMLATELPSVWFAKEAREKAERILTHSVATASVHGSLHPTGHERAEVQSLFVFIVETRSEEDAAALQVLTESNPPAEPTIAVHHRRLFTLAVGRSFEVGVASYETSERMKRFEEPFRAALQAANR